MDKLCTSLMDLGINSLSKTFPCRVTKIKLYKTQALFLVSHDRYNVLPLKIVLFVNSTAVTGVCYVRPIKTIWVAAGTAEANMYDPKSGENVSVL